MIAKAPTGTGKTFAFGIPVAEHIHPENDTVQAVILAPTRELAIQITDELRDLYLFHARDPGGLPLRRCPHRKSRSTRLKKHPQIVVATPGRLFDHNKRHTIDLSHVTRIVLDEADGMLEHGLHPGCDRTSST